MPSRNIIVRQNESTIFFIIIYIIIYERNVSRMVRWQDKKINAMNYAVTLQLTRAFCTGWSILSPHAEKRFDNEKMWYLGALKYGVSLGWCVLAIFLRRRPSFFQRMQSMFLQLRGTRRNVVIRLIIKRCLSPVCIRFFLLAVSGLRRKGTPLTELINFCICMGKVPMAR